MRANNRYGRVGILHFNKTATRLGHPIVIEERFKDGETVFTEQLQRIKDTKPDAIVIWGNPKESALILKAAREMGLNQPVYCSDRVVNPEFLSIAGKLADGIVTPVSIILIQKIRNWQHSDRITKSVSGWTLMSLPYMPMTG